MRNLPLLAILPSLIIHSVYAGFYESSPHVIELTSSNFDEIIQNTNYTSVVEFYAPWCGHCQNLKSVYKKVGTASEGLFQTAAIDCDSSVNKELCAKFQIKGFPTLMVFRPPKFDPNDHEKNIHKLTHLKHVSEVYNGERALTNIVDFVISRIKNYVKRISNEDLLNKFINGRTKTNKNKLLLLTDKQKPSPLIKSLAIDFLSDLELAYMSINSKNKEQIFELLKIEPTSKLPQVVVIDKSQDEDSFHLYDGKLDKLLLSEYLSEFGNPQEGPLSPREKVLKKYKKNNKKSNKSKPKSKKPKKSTSRDEL